MIDTADIVVIGSGALGASTAYHLAAGGARVALLDQHAIASQTSARAAGLSAEVRGSAFMSRLAMRGVEKLTRFTAETGEPLDLQRSGSMKVARRPEHAEQIEDDLAHGREMGIPVRAVDADEACRLMPFMRPEGILAASYNPRDVYLEPGQLPAGYARAAARLGCALLPDTRVEEILLGDDGGVGGVRTRKGEIRAPVVVDAAGAWLRRIAGEAGRGVPLVATRHQLLITEPLPGVEPGQPITRIIDANVYVRPCDGGLMLGGYESSPLQVAVEDLPEGYSIDDMPLDADVLRGLAALVEAQFPVFRDAPVRIVRGGLPTMSPDHEHVIGPVPGTGGLFVIGGCNVGGLSTAPAFGELLAAMVLGGDVPDDIGPLLPERFLGQEWPEAELRRVCRESYAFHYWSEQSREAALGRGPAAAAASPSSPDEG